MRKIFATMVFALAATVAFAQPGGIVPSGVKLIRGENQLVLEMSIAVSPDAVPRHQSVELVPVLSGSGEQSLRFPGVLVNGRGRVRIYQRHEKLGFIPKEQAPLFRVVNLWRGNSGATVDYLIRVAYEEWMDDANLNLVWILISPAGERHSYTSPAPEMQEIEVPE